LDTDYLPSAPVFVASILLFSYLNLAHYSRTPANSSLRNARRSQWINRILAWLTYGCVIAAALSGLALLHSTGTTSWWPASLLALGLLVSLIAVDRTVACIASRRQGGIDARAGAGGNGRPGNGGREDLAGDLFPEREEPVITEADLVSLDQRDREMLRSILRLDVTTAREIMVPRLDMVSVEADAAVTQVAELMTQGGHSRLPVYEDTIDRILGIVHSREVLEVLARGGPGTSLRDLVRPAFIIPETKRLDDLLEELQDRGVQMAIVVDEYGGTEGLVTMEDVLEEIVGEIEDEFTRTRESRVVYLPDGAVLLDAGVIIEDVEELLATRLGSTDVDTVGGYVYQALGKIPQVGDVIVTDHLRIEVVSILGRRLRKLRIERTSGNSSSSAT
jgi:CBS domain containing-hemolysin-like protein